MYIIRFQSFGSNPLKKRYKIIVIKKGAAVNSQAFKLLLGYYNQTDDTIKVDLVNFYLWLAFGAELSTPVKKLFTRFMFI